MDLVFPTINLNILCCPPSIFFRSQPTVCIFSGGVLVSSSLRSCCDVCRSILYKNSQRHLVLDCWLLCGSTLTTKKNHYYILVLWPVFPLIVHYATEHMKNTHIYRMSSVVLLLWSVLLQLSLFSAKSISHPISLIQGNPRWGGVFQTADGNLDATVRSRIRVTLSYLESKHIHRREISRVQHLFPSMRSHFGCGQQTKFRLKI